MKFIIHYELKILLAQMYTLFISKRYRYLYELTVYILKCLHTIKSVFYYIHLKNFALFNNFSKKENTIKMLFIYLLKNSFCHKCLVKVKRYL